MNSEFKQKVLQYILTAATQNASPPDTLDIPDCLVFVVFRTLLVFRALQASIFFAEFTILSKENMQIFRLYTPGTYN